MYMKRYLNSYSDDSHMHHSYIILVHGHNEQYYNGVQYDLRGILSRELVYASMGNK